MANPSAYASLGIDAAVAAPSSVAVPPLNEPGLVIPPDSPCVDRLCSSPNHGERSGHAAPDSIILHYTGMADGPSAIAWLCDPASQVSCHYVVEEDGTVLQLVPEARRAWHAGRSSWHGVTDMNAASIGIEIVNGGHDFGLPPFPERQIGAVVALVRDIALRQAIQPERLLAHSDVAPGRKRDPGPRFPWGVLHAQGLGHWVPEREAAGQDLGPGQEGDAVADLQRALAAYGYALEPTGRYDEATRIVVSAFQLHFRSSRVDGIADASTRATLADLSAARPSRPGSMQPRS